MPSNKAQARIDRDNGSVEKNIDALKANIEAATADPSSLRNAYHQAVSEKPEEILAGLRTHFPKATNIPESTDALLEELGTTAAEYDEMRTSYWIAQAQKRHEALISTATSGDMYSFYYDRLIESVAPLECETLPDLLEKIGADPEGKDIIATATEQNQFYGPSMERYIATLNDVLNAGIEVEEDCILD